MSISANAIPEWADQKLSADLPVLRARGENQDLEYMQAFPENVRELGKEIAAFATSNQGTIVLGVSDREQIAGWGKVERDFFMQHHLQLWLCGHYHKFWRQQVYPRANERPPLLLIQTPTGRIRNDSRRSFCLVELARENGKIEDAHVYQYCFSQDGIDRDGPHKVFAGG